MSSHIHRTSHKGRAVRIQAGWDRPLHQYYLIIEIVNPAETEPEAEDAGYLYSNLSDQGAWGCRDFSYFEGKLAELGLTVPAALLDGVRADCASNLSNHNVDYP
ncbi:hypothetical protein ACN8ZM_40255 (plasmid) [Burkholderia aenigmatica]|uniref:hypothetical protein n=1 Tax=Burkholderia aenigmatica TaxID=2015348 RepID=UPI003B43B77E